MIMISTKGFYYGLIKSIRKWYHTIASINFYLFKIIQPKGKFSIVR